MTPCCRNCRRFDEYRYLFGQIDGLWQRWHWCLYNAGTQIWPDETTCNEYCPKEITDEKPVRQTL